MPVYKVRSAPSLTNVDSTVMQVATQVSGARLVHSVGTDGNSPTAGAALYDIRRKLMSKQLLFKPTLKIEAWKGHVYAAIWWAPQDAPFGILRPERWHTTVIRAWLSRPMEYVTPYFGSWSTLLQGLVDAILLPQTRDDGCVAVWLTPPPWKASWTFGVPAEVEGAVGPIQCALNALILSVDRRAYVTPEADAHISWN